MAFIRYPEMFLLTLCFIFLCFTRRWILRRHKSCLPTKWPVIGMLPGVLQNVHRIHDYVTDIMKESGGTFKFEGPWFANMDTLVTSDPANIHHILIKNFSNFPKGPEFKRIFDLLGDGIFNSDAETWERQRKIAMSLLNHPKFLKYVAKTGRDKVEKGLIPVLEYFTELGTEVDLQDLSERFAFDTMSTLVFGQDAGSLSIDLPFIACQKAFGDAEEAFLYRHVLPESFWKIQKWLQVGKEKQLSKAWETLDLFIAECIAAKRKELSRNTTYMVEDQEEASDMLTAYMKAYDEKDDAYGNLDKYLRDNLLNLVFAGHTSSSTLAWFFWLLATNPSAEKKIREEIVRNLNPKEDYGMSSSFSDLEELKKLVYLHGALCESLRLFSPVPLQHKASLQPDILPTGNSIGAKTRMVLSFYAMGRMEAIWGKDCLEFKPERWITAQGGSKYEPSFKFIAFNTGPRSCLGKEMTFIQLKIIAIAIIYNYHIQVVEGHPISPSKSVILHMKDGLKVRITKRSV